jgi:hypothetical protein
MLQPLKPFQETPATQGYTIFAGVRWQQNLLQFSYEIRGNLHLILWPEVVSSPGQRDGLWQTTCLEAFIARSDQSGYLEINLSPSGESAVYAFTDYRVHSTEFALPEAIDSLELPKFTCEKKSQLFSLQAELDLRDYEFAQLNQASELRFGLTAVIEHQDRSKAYFALDHVRISPESKPDFHQAQTFTWNLRKV